MVCIPSLIWNGKFEVAKTKMRSEDLSVVLTILAGGVRFQAFGMRIMKREHKANNGRSCLFI